MTSTMRRCWMLRHGSSLANEAGGSADSWTIPLTTTGLRQAQEAALRWSSIAPPVFRLYSSPMLRALQTAQFVQDLFPQAQLEVIHELHEFTPFDFSQRPPMRPVEREPLLRPYWERCDSHEVGIGAGAESFVTFKQRVELALTRLRAGETDSLAVCHGGVINLAQLLLDPASSQLDEVGLMRAWIARSTVQNCGMVEL